MQKPLDKPADGGTPAEIPAVAGEAGAEDKPPADLSGAVTEKEARGKGEEAKAPVADSGPVSPSASSVNTANGAAEKEPPTPHILELQYRGSIRLEAAQGIHAD